jgi:hypothetical protein
MRNRRRQSSPIERLRLAIDCMPVATREAMLQAVQAGQRMIAGAYVDRQGGTCPMLAAHRRGGRTDFISFARSWDRFTRASGKSREATEREVRILATQLEASLETSSGLELDEAIREHRQLRSLRLHSRPRLPDSADPSGEVLARRLRAKKRVRSLGRGLSRAAGPRVSSLV